MKLSLPIYLCGAFLFLVALLGICLLGQCAKWLHLPKLAGWCQAHLPE